VRRNPLNALAALGQSIWLDYIQRGIISSGELRRLIEEDGLTGITSNPSIFQKAIAGSDDYDQDIRAVVLEGQSVKEICDALSVKDVQSAADELRSVYVTTDGHDGYVSLEVNPHAAHNTEATVTEAHSVLERLHEFGIDIDQTALQLENQGVGKFNQALDELVATLAEESSRYAAVNGSGWFWTPRNMLRRLMVVEKVSGSRPEFGNSPGCHGIVGRRM
jgi:transaldolase